MQPLAHVIPRALAELLRASPLSTGKVEFAWKAAVGPAVERVTSVRLEGTALLVDAQTAQWRHEVMRSSPLILKRMQTLLGEQVVRELVVRG